MTTPPPRPPSLPTSKYCLQLLEPSLAVLQLRQRYTSSVQTRQVLLRRASVPFFRPPLPPPSLTRQMSSPVEPPHTHAKCLYRSLNYAKTLKLRFRVGDLDRPERRKRYTSSRVEEEEGAQNCPCGNASESRTYMLDNVNCTSRNIMF